jgi:hypothetical protein
MAGQTPPVDGYPSRGACASEETRRRSRRRGLSRVHSPRDTRRHASGSRQNHRLPLRRIKNGHGIADSTTGETNQLSQSGIGLHHRWRYRCCLRYVSCPSSSLACRLSQIHRLSLRLPHERTRRTRKRPPLFVHSQMSYCGEGCYATLAVKAAFIYWPEVCRITCRLTGTLVGAPSSVPGVNRY